VLTSVAGKDDHIALETRVLSGFILPFLLIAFAILYLWPADTGRLFAWPIAPPMSSRLLGSAYAGGVYFFIRVVLERQWHRVWVGFLPVTVFATLMLIATVVHWDKFSHDKLAFWAWIASYATTPLLVFAAWWRNRRTDPGAPEHGDARIPSPVGWAMGGIGIVVLAAGLGLFLAPGSLISYWPWHLTPLTARVTGSCFALAGVFGVVLAGERRWSAARIAFQSQMIGIALMLAGVARSWGDFDTSKALTWAFTGGLGAMLVGLIALTLVLEGRRRRLAAPR
jgi:hypothetical protein